MADTLYLSLWYPNLRLATLADKLTAVLNAFSAHGGESRVYSATVWPVSWSESPVLQQVYGRRIGAAQPDGGLLDSNMPGMSTPGWSKAGATAVVLGAEPRLAVREALELLHDDYAYEFQIGWSLWELEAVPGDADPLRQASLRSAQDDKLAVAGRSTPATAIASAQGHSLDFDARWVREPRLVRVTGYGPLFDDGAYEADGHIRIDFGSDTPFLEEGVELDSTAARHVEENVRQLVELTAAVEKDSGATARLLWSELGESLAQRLAKRLGVAN